MEIDNLFDILLAIVIAGLGWFLHQMNAEIQRVQILLNRTREEYATKFELKADMDRLIEYLHRIEDKIDRITK